MASSRWKRFAFFEKHTLSVPAEVLNDLTPRTGAAGRAAQQDESLIWDDVSMVVSTASLPLNSKPSEMYRQSQGSSSAAGNLLTDPPRQHQQQPQPQEAVSLSQMWSSLNACTSPGLTSDVAGASGNLSAESGEQQQQTSSSSFVNLPSQSQSLHERDQIGETFSEDSLDGLVLVFTASQSTPFIHCFDVTVRCNPPAFSNYIDITGADTNEYTTTDNAVNELQDLDGWRGYIRPFAQPENEGIIALATCRSTDGHRPLHLACISKQQLCIWEDPHLDLSCRLPLASPRLTERTRRIFLDSWNSSKDGHPAAVDVVPGIVALGTDTGAVLVFVYGSLAATGTSTRSATGSRRQGIHLYLRIPPPPSDGMSVASVKISPLQPENENRSMTNVFVAYRKSQESQNAGICCFDMPTPGPNAATLSAPSARHDLDGRHVATSGLCDAVATPEGYHFTVARNDGLYSYNSSTKIEVAPIDGPKLSICVLSPPSKVPGVRSLPQGSVGAKYTLVASTDAKSDRDVVDIYDITNRLVSFHLLLSPGHRAAKTAGITTAPARDADGRLRGGRSSAMVLTSGGSLLSFTEKVTEEKVSLLVQKNLFSAAVAVAFSASLEPSSVAALYRRYAEYLYRKGDYAASMEQYIKTIGSLEPSHVTFRFLAAPTIQYLVQYLEALKAQNMATPVHCDLLRTCYLKLNDTEAAESLSTATASSSLDRDAHQSILSNLSSNPAHALTSICSLEAPQAAEILLAHGASLARVMPRETAGIVVSLCVGTYSPTALADASNEVVAEAKKMLSHDVDERNKTCNPFPVRLFYSAFLDNSKLLRLILSHCNRNKCHLTPSLRRTLLELTLQEWNNGAYSSLCDITTSFLFYFTS